MIYITGDTHGLLTRFLELRQYGWTEEDTLIIAGDFGYIWGNDLDRDKLHALESLRFNIAFVDGNHECFPRINAYPVETVHGGKVHRIRSNIVHLMRGQVFDMEGMKIFTMGGGLSIDKALRREGISWWPEEMPSEAEYAEGLENLRRRQNAVDVIISHAAPMSGMEYFRQKGMIGGPAVDERRLNDYLQYVEDTVRYSRHYFGHLHLDMELWRGQIALYSQVYCVNTGKPVSKQTVIGV